MAFPQEEVEAWSRLTCEADAVWHKAKLANDWDSFEPYIDRMVDALKRQAGYLDSSRDPYDVWLDQYERGMDAASYDKFFSQVRETVVPLVRDSAASSPRRISSPRACRRASSATCPSTL